MNTVIKLSRCKEIAPSREDAIVYLDTHAHSKGEPVIVEYYKDETKTETDILFAIGLNDGTGRNCYSIESIGEETVISGVTFEDEDLIDISATIHQQKYLSCCQNYIEKEGDWVIVTIENRLIKKIEKVEEEQIFRDIFTGFRWYFSGNVVKREDDFYTKSQTDKRIEDYLYTAVPIEMFVETGNTVFIKQYNEPFFRITVTDFTGKDITSECEITFTSDTRGKESIERIDEGNKYVLDCQNITETTIYTVTATYRGSSISQDFTFWISSRIRYKTKKIDNLGSLLIEPTSDYATFTFNLNNDCSIVEIPEVFPEVKHIYDVHGLDYLDDYTVEKKDGYNCYIKKDAVTINGFKQKFIFKEDEDI